MNIYKKAQYSYYMMIKLYYIINVLLFFYQKTLRQIVN